MQDIAATATLKISSDARGLDKCVEVDAWGEDDVLLNMWTLTDSVAGATTDDGGDEIPTEVMVALTRDQALEVAHKLIEMLVETAD